MRSSIYLWCTNIRHYSIQKGIKVMSNNLSKSIKELTISYLSDGQMRSTKEIKTFLTKNNVNFEKAIVYSALL